MVEFSSGTTRVVCVPMGHSMYPPIRVLYIDFHLTYPEGFCNAGAEMTAPAPTKNRVKPILRLATETCIDFKSALTDCNTHLKLVQQVSNWILN